MEAFYLLKLGEINLKLGNKEEFESRLRGQLERKLKGIPHSIECYPGRYFLAVDEVDESVARLALSTTPGINGFARATKCRKSLEDILAASDAIARTEIARGKHRFKAETRRSDKSFQYGSYEVSSMIGEKITEQIAGTVVDVHSPEFTIHVEIRERVYVYGDTESGLRGLPVGSGGRGLLLLSGGIDSPVAGYLMAKRGLDLSAVYFHAYPFTSEEARKKVVDLASVLARYTAGLILRVVSFTEIQKVIKAKAPSNATTLMMRAAMMEVAHRLAIKISANCIVTGESLGQVASQTAENIRFTQNGTNLAVLRPLIGMDKEDTIMIARKLGTYTISILPFEDCCVLFSPKHPVLKADFEGSRSCYRALGLDSYIEEAIASTERLEIPWRAVVQDQRSF